MPKRIPRLARSHPFQTVFLVGATAIAIWSGVLTARVFATEERQRSQEAARTAAIQATYTACIRSIPFLTKFNKAVAGAEEWGRIQLLNGRQLLEAVEPGLLRRQLIVNLERQRDALDDSRGLRVPVPTKKVCAERRADALDN